MGWDEMRIGFVISCAMMISLMSGCGLAGGELATQMLVTYSTGSPTVPVGSPEGKMATQTPAPSPTASPTATVSYLLTPSAIPIPLDPAHWTHFTSPTDVLLSDVQHIDQGQNGTMWFGGIKIYRYDGKNWSIYDQKSIPVFQGHVIESLAVAPGGTVWIGTENNEVVSFDGTTWKSLSVEEGGYRDNWITSIVIRKNGELCAVSIEGMSCLDGENWVHHPIVVQKTVNRVYVRNAVLTTADEIWVPVDNGVLYHYDGKNWESIQVSSWICCLSPSHDGSLWIYDHEGFGKLNPKNGKIDYHWTPALISEHAEAIKEATDGTLWFGTGQSYQVAHYIHGSYITADGQLLKDSVVQYDYGSNGSFPFYHVSYIFQAMDGSMWFGTVGGIFRYK